MADPDSNTAAVLYGINDLRVHQWELPKELAAGHVRVQMSNVGICGSDVHYLQHGRIGDFVVDAPMVIGHESSGVVAAVGPGVTRLAVGDRVALEPGAPCWHCKAAREGRYNLDPDIQFFATPPVHGSLASFVDHPAELCYKLPASVTLEEGAMCEPLSVGVHACRRAQVQPGKSVAVLGAGPIGLVVLMCAQAFGADQVVITDVRQSCLNFAAQHYAATTLLTTPQQTPSDLAQQLQHTLAAAAAGADPTPAAATAAGVPDIVIDCVGVQQTLEAAVRAVAPGGKIVLVGMGSDQLQLPATLLTCKEVDLLGSFRYCNTYPLCISLIASKRVHVAPMITHRFPFSAAGVAEGFDTAARAAQTGAIKVMFDLQQQQQQQQEEEEEVREQ
ncbi:hypothetical protein OEZ85_004961 [Tetradesmus obliquus]|uniref:Enoyl reductase (ER) domain-containing protein n=1 Tax=Tetradesmus obliquus TaxID=3088 RepID=A0ABY8UGE0_TETOB|nr:hypothetical protein OEZ85_004961 [Tetradesmus obliquus]